MRASSSDFYFGGRNARELALAERFAGAVTGETILSSDDGSLGEKGFVTQALARRLAAGAAYARVYACGPMPMFAALAEGRRAGRDLLGVLDRGGDGLRLRRVPRLRDPGDREAVHRVVQRGADSEPGEDPVVRFPTSRFGAVGAGLVPARHNAGGRKGRPYDTETYGSRRGC